MAAPRSDPDTLAITPAAVWRGALGTFGRRWRFVVGFTLAVFAVLEVAEYLSDVEVDRIDAYALVRLAGALLSAGLFLGGTSYSAGVFDHLVAADQHGAEEPHLRELFTGLPHARLIAVVILLAVVVTVGFALCFVPGVVLLTFWCIAAPMVVIENRGVFGAFGRSFRLTRKHFWPVLGAVTVPLIAEHLLEEALHSVHYLNHYRVLGSLVRGLVAASFGAFVALTEVTMAHRLVRRAPEPEPARGTRHRWREPRAESSND